MPLEPCEDSFLFISDDFELVVKEEEDGWCHVQNSTEEHLVVAPSSPSTPAASPSPSDKKNEDLFFYDTHYDEALRDDNNREETAVIINDLSPLDDEQDFQNILNEAECFEQLDAGDLDQYCSLNASAEDEATATPSDPSTCQDEWDVQSILNEDEYFEQLEQEAFIDFYCPYGNDGFLDASAEEFGANRKITLKSSRQRKREAAKRIVDRLSFVNHRQLNCRKYKKHMKKERVQDREMDCRRKLKFGLLMPKIWY